MCLPVGHLSLQLVSQKEQDTGEGDADDGRSLGDKKKFGRDISARGRICISISSLTKSKMFLKLRNTAFQTLITRQSYQQKMKHYIIKKTVLAINLINSERIPGLPLTGDSELSV